MKKNSNENKDFNTNNEQAEQIADVFQKRFNHFGFKKTSVDDVAKEMKISKKTIYSFFSTKEKIFYFIVSRVAKTLSNQMAKKLNDCSTSTEKITKLVNLIFIETKKWLKDGNDAFEFQYKYEISEIAFKNAYNALFQEIINEGVKNEEFKSVNIDLTVLFINGIFSESMKSVNKNPDLNLEIEVVNAILKLLK
jgi:AcrR family transcriptional regulator